jgi:hypothetical protein
VLVLINCLVPILRCFPKNGVSQPCFAAPKWAQLCCQWWVRTWALYCLGSSPGDNGKCWGWRWDLAQARAGLQRRPAGIDPSPVRYVITVARPNHSSAGLHLKCYRPRVGDFRTSLRTGTPGVFRATWLSGYMIVVLHVCRATWLSGYMIVVLHVCRATCLSCYMIVVLQISGRWPTGIQSCCVIVKIQIAICSSSHRGDLSTAKNLLSSLNRTWFIRPYKQRMQIIKSLLELFWLIENLKS